MFTKLDKAELKLEELRKKDQSYTVKTHKNVPTSYELGVSKEVLNKENEHIYHRGENCERRIFAEKIIYNFANFPKKKKIVSQKIRQNIGQRKLVLYAKVNLLDVIKITEKSETIVTIEENINKVHIQ